MTLTKTSGFFFADNRQILSVTTLHFHRYNKQTPNCESVWKKREYRIESASVEELILSARNASNFSKRMRLSETQ